MFRELRWPSKHPLAADSRWQLKQIGDVLRPPVDNHCKLNIFYALQFEGIVMAVSENTVSEKSLPPVGEHVIVQCQSFSCLGYLGRDGKWKCVFGNLELSGVLSFSPIGQPASWTGWDRR